MEKIHPDVARYFQASQNLQEELETLRRIILDCGLNEDFKWRTPCYTLEGKNVVLLAALKDSCVISFFKGVLLKDAQQVLTKPGKNSQTDRLMHFRSSSEINEKQALLRAYIQEAIEVEKSGMKLKFKDTADYEFPEEFQQKLDEDSALKTAFEALTPGRQRAYLLYFSAPKQSKTRTARVEKYTPRILDGKGLNDCVCGLSKRYPVCDGSHKCLK